MKSILSTLLALCFTLSLTACTLAEPLPSSTSDSATDLPASSEPSSSEEALDAMDNNTAIDTCLRMYNILYPISRMKSPEEIEKEALSELERLITRAKKYHSDSEQKTLYTLAMAEAARQTLHYGQEGFTEETFTAAIDSAEKAYYAMYMGFRQELRFLEKSQWKKAAEVLSQRP